MSPAVGKGVQVHPHFCAYSRPRVGGRASQVDTVTPFFPPVRHALVSPAADTQGWNLGHRVDLLSGLFWKWQVEIVSDEL